jgi:hypothetical protein
LLPYSAKDIRKAKENGSTAILPHVENAQLIDNDPEHVGRARTLVARGNSDEAIKKSIVKTC